MRRLPRLRLSLLAATAGVALLAAALWSIRQDPETYPWGDAATTSIYAKRAIAGDLLVGAYSRFYWNHPGPLLYQYLAPFYALSGYREVSLKWAALLLHLATVGAIVGVVRRRSPLLAVGLAMTLTLLILREPRLQFSTWNPIVPVLPLLLAAVLGAVVADGSLVMLPALIATLSFVVQSHIGLAVPAAAIVIVTIVLAAIHFRSSGAPVGNWRPAVATTAVVVVVLWSMPIYAELHDARPNLAAIAEFFHTASYQPPTALAALAILGGQLLGPLLPAWPAATPEVTASITPLTVGGPLVEFVLLIAGGILARRAGHRFLGSLALISAAMSLSGLVAIRAIAGEIFDYLILWQSAIGMLNLATIVAVAACLRGIRRAAPALVDAILVGWCVGAALVGIVHLRSKHLADARVTTTRALALDLERYCDTHAVSRPLLESHGPGWREGTGIVLQFYKADRTIAVTDDMVHMVGARFRAAGTETAHFYLMDTNDSAPPGETEWVTTRGTWRIVRLLNAHD